MLLAFPYPVQASAPESATTESSPAAPKPQPDQVWNNLLNQHYAYAQTIEQALPLPPPASPEPPFRCFAETGTWMVHSYFGTNPIFRFVTRSRAPASPPMEAHSFDYSVDFGPRLTVGAAGPGGLGVRGSWWQLEAKAGSVINNFTGAVPSGTISSVIVTGVPGFTFPGPLDQQLRIFRDRFAFDNHVHVQAWDGEVFQAFHSERWSFLVSGGGRYGYLSQGYRAFRFNSGTSRSGTTVTALFNDSDVVTSGRNFSGIGPTVALEARRVIVDTSVSLYGSARGSVLFGRERTRSFQRTSQVSLTSTGSAAPRPSVSNVIQQGGSGQDLTIPVGDFEAGVEWRTAYGRLQPVGRAGLVNQTWFDSGSATSSRGVAGFFGLRLTAGIDY
jgi:hypothetical protein